MPDYETMYNELKEYNEGLEQEDFSSLVVDDEEGFIDTDSEYNFD